jgi:hypothetical protein
MALVERRQGDPIGRDEAAAGLAARAELGPEYDDALAESFADRIEQVVQARVAELSHGDRARSRELAARGQRQMALGIVSLGTGIPITAIAGSVAEPGLAGIIAAWAGIVGVNLAHALQGRRDR